MYLILFVEYKLSTVLIIFKSYCEHTQENIPFCKSMQYIEYKIDQKREMEAAKGNVYMRFSFVKTD